MKPSLLFCLPNPKLLTYFLLCFATFRTSGQQPWIEVPTPDPSETRNMLRDITGTSSNDVWTVGSYETTPGNMKNLILHWNGSAWQSFPNTDQSSTLNDLWGVTALTSNDVWAVGAKNINANTDAQLIHWNGSSWTHTNLPVNPGGSYLDGIAAIAANDIWAVGGQAGSPTRPSYTIHYDGSSWTEVSAPNVGAFRNAFYDVDCIAANDVWAVGHYGHQYGDYHAMAQHWNGSNWTNVALPPNITTPLGELYSVTMIASDDVWALGSTLTGSLLMIHYDGNSWEEMPTAGSSGGAVVYNGVNTFSVGYRISQWDGNSWTVIDSINQVEYPTLGSAVAFANGDVWAAGVSGDPELLTFVYRSDPAQTLAVSMTDYRITKEDNYAVIEWTTSSETNAGEFVMERSADGLQFYAVNKINAAGVPNRYRLVDDSPPAGKNFYRLKLIDFDGTETIFPIVVLSFDHSDAFTVYPNPVNQPTVNISLPGKGRSQLLLSNQMGQEVMRWNIEDGDDAVELNLPIGLSGGVYFLTLVDGDNVKARKIFIEN